MAKIEIITTQDVKLIYTDSYTRAHHDLTVFEPNLPDGFYMVGHYGQGDHAGFIKGTVPLVKPLDEDVIAPPISFEQEWNNKGCILASQDVSLWRVVAPPGYVALGDVISIGYDPPTDLKEKYACIRADLTIEGRIGNLIWNDGGSGAYLTVSLWSVQPTVQGVTGYFKVQQGYDFPTEARVYCVRSAV